MDLGITIRTGLVAALGLAVLLQVPPGLAASLTLQQATERAVARAPLLDARRAGVASAQAEAARAGQLPDPMLTVGIDNLPVTGDDAFDPNVEDMTMKRIGLEQEVPAGAERAARRELAARVVDEASSEEVAERLAIERAAANAWIEAWGAGHRLTALQSLRAQAVLTARLVKARLAAGSGTAVESLAAEMAIREVDSDILAVQALRAQAIATLAQWVPEATAEVSMPDADWGVLPVSEARLRANVDSLAPLLVERSRVERAAAESALARAESRPDWNVSAYYGQRDGGRSDMIGIEVAVELPLFRRNRQDRGVAARDADYRAALATQEARSREAAAAIEAGLAHWNGLQRQVALHETDLLPLAADRSAAALAAYRAGGDLQPWLDARRAELDALRSHADHLGELAHAWVALAYLLPKENRP